ncbi:MAG TPA: farnesyl diphosphate synthase [Candidatus Binatia bacterium]
MNVQAYLNKRQQLIENSLDRYLSLSGFQPYPKNLHAAMRYCVFSGGKRFRPMLTLVVGEFFGAKPKSLLPFACALELIHTYSLIHDDLPALDNDDLRRGQPSAHKQFGEGIALLAGDALLTEAFSLMTRRQAVGQLEAGLVLDLIHEVADAAGIRGMVGGQSIDLEAEGLDANIEAVERIHRRKTGALILAAARVGARIAGAAPKDLKRISRYAESLGLAFQITDDLLDVAAPGGEAHGAAPCVREESKKTYPSVAGVASARARVAQLLKKCLKEVEPYGGEADLLRDIARFVAERAV